MAEMTDRSWRCTCMDAHWISLVWFPGDARYGADIQGWLCLDGDFRARLRRRLMYSWQALCGVRHTQTSVEVCLDGPKAREISAALLEFADACDAEGNSG